MIENKVGRLVSRICCCARHCHHRIAHSNTSKRRSVLSDPQCRPSATRIIVSRVRLVVSLAQPLAPLCMHVMSWMLVLLSPTSHHCPFMVPAIRDRAKGKPHRSFEHVRFAHPPSFPSIVDSMEFLEDCFLRLSRLPRAFALAIMQARVHPSVSTTSHV